MVAGLLDAKCGVGQRSVEVEPSLLDRLRRLENSIVS
jgi:hypothetical protein